MSNDELKIDADDLFCDDEVTKAAIDSFGIKYLYPWQRLVVENILESYREFKSIEKKNFSNKETINKNDEDDFFLGKQIVLLPTGAGKSLCFQIPAILLDGPTLIIYPLLALMSDQERRMTSGNLQSVVFRGGQSESEYNENFEKIKKGAKIIIANPEILANEKLLNQLCDCSISHIAIDEAHCVSEWGDSFRPAYLELGNIIKKINPPIITAFTATASPEVLARVSDVLFDGKAHVVRSDSDRPNIHYYVKESPSKKQAALFLSRTEARPMIIFCGTRRRAEDMSMELNVAFGFETSKFYHAGLEKKEKAEIEKWFFEQKDAVLCATCAYGMGVDKKDIHTVIHLDPPQTAEAYIQEAGRGGRDGSVANAILLWNKDDEIKFSNYKEGSRKAAMKDFVKTKDCRRQVLLNALGAEQAVCSGCDICDNKKRISNYFRIPGDELPNLEFEVFNEIKKNNRYYTRKTLEEKYLKKVNNYSRHFVGVNIWWYNSFEEIIESLLFKNKIIILEKLWKDKLAINKKNIT